MVEQLLLLLRISKPEYNATLYGEHTLFMNPQISFKNETLTPGQRDEQEGAITNLPCEIKFSTDEKKTWKTLGKPTSMFKDNKAYIYCMYGLKYNKDYYDADKNKYYHLIPWEHIEPLWQGKDTELVIVTMSL